MVRQGAVLSKMRWEYFVASVLWILSEYNTKISFILIAFKVAVHEVALSDQQKK